MLELPYEDGARTIFLNTKGSLDSDSNEQLFKLLKYVENSTSENAITDELQELHSYVGEIKQRKEVGVRYMKSWERDHMMFEKGKLEGKEMGEQNGNIDCILELLSDKGSIPIQVETIIRNEQDLETLKRWFRIAIKASSVEEFVASSGLEV